MLLAVPFPSATGLAASMAPGYQNHCSWTTPKEGDEGKYRERWEDKTWEDGQWNFMTQFCSLSFSDVRRFLYHTGKDLGVISG